MINNLYSPPYWTWSLPSQVAAGWEHLHDWSQHRPSQACKSQRETVPDTHPRIRQGRNKKKQKEDWSFQQTVTKSQIGTVVVFGYTKVERPDSVFTELTGWVLSKWEARSLTQRWNQVSWCCCCGGHSLRAVPGQGHTHSGHQSSQCHRPGGLLTTKSKRILIPGLLYLPHNKGCHMGRITASALSEWSRSVVSDSLRPHGLKPTRILPPWDSPGKNTGVGYLFLLQGIFPTQGSNPGLLHCR